MSETDSETQQVKDSIVEIALRIHKNASDPQAHRDLETAAARLKCLRSELPSEGELIRWWNEMCDGSSYRHEYTWRFMSRVLQWAARRNGDELVVPKADLLRWADELEDRGRLSKRKGF